mgnify:CR=1 FL=1|tara:strand:- start:434 stop:664 length:231 start_codon:yes stop_codon:yes gene_type:complete
MGHYAEQYEADERAIEDASRKHAEKLELQIVDFVNDMRGSLNRFHSWDAELIDNLDSFEEAFIIWKYRKGLLVDRK